jgi:large conductance mechanosensitive channel
MINVGVIGLGMMGQTHMDVYAKHANVKIVAISDANPDRLAGKEKAGGNIEGQAKGGLDFSSYFILLGPVPEGYAGSMTNYAALKEAGAPVFGYGQFVTVLINFLILAFIIFLLVRWANRLRPKAEPGPAPDPADIVLLREIRDELRKKA